VVVARRTDLETNDRIRLQLPAQAAYGRLARIAATTLARRLEFGFRAIEDLGLALDETLILLLSDPRRGPASAVELVLAGADGGLVVDVALQGVATEGRSAGGDPGGLDDEALDRFRFLVGEVVQEWSVDVPRASVHLVARR
jgi:hypothetical protein